MSKKKRQQRRAEKRREFRAFMAEHGAMIEACDQALEQVDPVGMVDYENYFGEALDIVPQLRDCRSAVQVELVLNRVFEKWFGPGLDGVVRPGSLERASHMVWRLMEVHGYRA